MISVCKWHHCTTVMASPTLCMEKYHTKMMGLPWMASDCPVRDLLAALHDMLKSEVPNVVCRTRTTG